MFPAFIFLTIHVGSLSAEREELNENCQAIALLAHLVRGSIRVPTPFRIKRVDSLSPSLNHAVARSFLFDGSSEPSEICC